jgi:hypothetical protein
MKMDSYEKNRQNSFYIYQGFGVAVPRKSFACLQNSYCWTSTCSLRGIDDVKVNPVCHSGNLRCSLRVIKRFEDSKDKIDCIVYLVAKYANIHTKKKPKISYTDEGISSLLSENEIKSIVRMW